MVFLVAALFACAVQPDQADSNLSIGNQTKVNIKMPPYF
jgi:hypothetical protein